jgi:Domain of unknown function (DUF4442)
MASTNSYRSYQRLAKLPSGKRLFSLAVMARVPDFASILPHVERMEPGLAVVTIPNWWFVHNHLATVHAIASCNAADGTSSDQCRLRNDAATLARLTSGQPA